MLDVATGGICRCAKGSTVSAANHRRSTEPEGSHEDAAEKNGKLAQPSVCDRIAEMG
jgi:hypothetical protein